jgi:hypothetical protein
MSQTTIEFLERLRQYIQNETSTQYKELERQWAHPLYEMVALILSISATVAGTASSSSNGGYFHPQAL